MSDICLQDNFLEQTVHRKECESHLLQQAVCRDAYNWSKTYSHN